MERLNTARIEIPSEVKRAAREMADKAREEAFGTVERGEGDEALDTVGHDSIADVQRDEGGTSMSDAEKMELEALRKEKADAERKAEAERAEKADAERKAELEALRKEKAEAEERAERAERAYEEQGKKDNISRHGGPVTDKLPHEQDGYGRLDIGRLMKGQFIRSTGAEVPRDLEREISWLDNGRYRDGLYSNGEGKTLGVVPFEFLNQRAMERAAMVKRAAGLSAAPISTMVDTADAAPFLMNMAPILSRFNVETGVSGKREVFWGNHAPNRSRVADGGNIVSNDGTVTNVTLSPSTVVAGYEYTSALMVADAGAFADFVDNSMLDLFNEELLQAVLVGAGGNDHTGIWSQTGVVTKNHGTADTDFTRDTVSDVREALLAGIPNGSDRIWIGSNGFISLATKESYGANSDRFVWEYVGGDEQRCLNDTAFRFTLLTPSGSTNPAIVVNASAVKVLIWGSGVEMIRRPSTTKAEDEVAFRMHTNSVVIQPKNAIKTQRGAP